MSKIIACVAGICLAMLIGPDAAQAGFDNPLHHSFKPHLIQRCPKLSNPIECTGDNNNDAAENNHRHHTDKWKHKQRQQCKRLHLEYEFRHPIDTPTDLKPYHGCHRWRLDDAYHTQDIHTNVPPLVSWR